MIEKLQQLIVSLRESEEEFYADAERATDLFAKGALTGGGAAWATCAAELEALLQEYVN